MSPPLATNDVCAELDDSRVVGPTAERASDRQLTVLVRRIGEDHSVHRLIARLARCADPRGTYTSLFFSDDVRDTQRARAICAGCPVRELCLTKALERREPFGVWGGEFLMDGEIVKVRRGRGRPPKIARPAQVDEVTGIPVVA